MPKKGKSVRSSRGPKVAFSPDPIPPETRVTLVYQDIVSPTAALNTWARQYRLTSLFDPDASGVGNQPLAFDEWMRLYLNYRVESCSYRLEVSTRTANGQISVAAAPYGGGTVITDPEVIATLPMAKTASSMNGAEAAVVSGKVHASLVYGVPKGAIATNDQFWGTSSTNPTLETILNIAATTSGASDVATYKVVMKFRVVFFRPGLVLLSAARQRQRSLLGAAAMAPPSPCTITLGGSSPDPFEGMHKPSSGVVPAGRAGGMARGACQCPMVEQPPSSLQPSSFSGNQAGGVGERPCGQTVCACSRAPNQ